MATATTVNEQITDSITQANTKVIGDVPSMAMGNLMTTISTALSNAGHNSTSNQNYSNIMSQTATTQGVNSLTSIVTASVGRSSEEVIDKR